MNPAPEFQLQSRDFGPDFLWGAATSAYQIEGAWNQDGKEPSIWDAFSHKRWRVKKNQNGDRACQSYQRYKEDVTLLSRMGMNAYRFSLAWSRLVHPQIAGRTSWSPAGGYRHSSTAIVNPCGFDYYKRLLESLHAAGIRPFVTLYHWDLPQRLETSGGWASRDIIKYFEEYAAICVQELGHLVKDWIVLNEPAVFLPLGYLLGVHAPGRRGLKRFLRASHYALLAQAAAARSIRSLDSGCQIGTTISTDGAYPASDSQRDQIAARRYDALMNRLYVDPVFGEGYPLTDLPMLKKMEQYIKGDDLANLQFDFDFLGVNNYTSHRIKHAVWMPWLKARPLPFAKRSRRTAMGWEVYPAGLRDQLIRFGTYEKIKSLYVTENGIALDDVLTNGAVPDAERIRFFQNYLSAVRDAQRAGAPVQGYFAWSLLDNFEWAAGYRPRFGLAWVDFASGDRVLKESGYWWREFLTK
ncbi:MAG: beta-glucosidase [Leptospiraceae bacterium]|nr:beta-glucosidase [Leptospiraceae bacterium]